MGKTSARKTNTSGPDVYTSTCAATGASAADGGSKDAETRNGMFPNLSWSYVTFRGTNPLEKHKGRSFLLELHPHNAEEAETKKNNEH